MGTDVAGFFIVFFFFGCGAPEAERFFFVDVCAADRDGDGEDGDVHHDEVGDLDAGVEIGEVHVSEASGAGRDGLEEAIENTITRGANICYRGVVKLALC